MSARHVQQQPALIKSCASLRHMQHPFLPLPIVLAEAVLGPGLGSSHSLLRRSGKAAISVEPAEAFPARACLAISLGCSASSSYRDKSDCMASSESAFNVDGQSFLSCAAFVVYRAAFRNALCKPSREKGLAWSYEVYCGGARAVFQYTAWEHIGGADTMEQTPMTSSSHLLSFRGSANY